MLVSASRFDHQEDLFVGPLLLEFRHNDGEIGCVQQNRRVISKHRVSHSYMEKIGIIDQPENSVDKVGR